MHANKMPGHCPARSFRLLPVRGKSNLFTPMRESITLTCSCLRAFIPHHSEEGRGRSARAACKHFLSACQTDEEGRSNCATRCARYFTKEDDLKRCISDCNKARCRVYPPYDDCVAFRTLRNVIACMEAGEGRSDAESCLRERCGLQPQTRPLSADVPRS